VVAALPADGLAAFDRLKGIDDTDVAWIVRENRKKARLRRLLGKPGSSRGRVSSRNPVRPRQTRGMSVDPAAEIEYAVHAALPATVAPWTAAARRLDDGTWAVIVTHEVSNGLVFETGQVEVADVVDSAIRSLAQSQEVQRVARAPKLQHPSTIAGIRGLVQTFGWTRTEVAAVVGLLEEVQALDADEAEWFTASFGEDRPPPRATTIV
jgi:hypothetical protein